MRDEKYKEVKKFVEENDYAPSLSGLQRRFQIGYNRAADYIDYLIVDGVLIRDEHSKWRLLKVL